MIKIYFKQKIISFLICLLILVATGVNGYAHFSNGLADKGTALSSAGIAPSAHRPSVKRFSNVNVWLSRESQAPQFTVKGSVRDSLGNPLVGVSVNLKGSGNGTVTNAMGNYSLGLPNDHGTLVFSYIGYNRKEVPVKGRLEINVVMDATVSSLDQLVVVAMGKQKEESVLGSIARVKMDDIKDIPSTSVTNAIAGKMAGAVTVQRSGEIGLNTTSFWIRGISTFGSNQTPLILVDGVERSLNDVSINEIESVSILKDAAATAVYGSQAANGVVLVTTRHGKTGKPQVEVNLQYGITDLPTMPKYLGGAQYAQLYNEAFGRTNYSDQYIQNVKDGTDPYLYPDVDWFKETFTKYSQNSLATIDMHGGSKSTQYFVNFGYYNEIGNLRNDPSNSYKSNLILNKYSYRSNVDIQVFPKTKINLEVGGYLSDLNSPGIGGPIYGANYTPAQTVFYYANLSTPISTPVRVPIDVLPDGTKVMGWGAPTQVGEKNPAERLMGSGYDTRYESQLLTQLTINQDLSDLTKGLDAKFSFSFDDYNTTAVERRKFSSTYGVVGEDNDGNPITTEVDKGDEFLGYTRSLGSNRSEELKAQLNYNTVISSKHNIGGMVTYYQRDYRTGDASSEILSLPEREQGLAVRATYNYAERYFFEFDMGYNGSENFEKGHRFGLFPAVAGGWLVSREPFWKGVEQTINLLKLKGSVGLVGSQALPGGDRFGYITVYGAGLGGYSFGGPSPTAYTGVGLERAGISDLTWETGLKKDVGIQMEMFNGVVSLDVDYFHELRSRILTERISLPGLVGINSTPYANIGKMSNKGIEGTIAVSKALSQNGSIRFYGNFSFIKNKILNMDEPPRKYPYEQRTGHPLGQEFGLIAQGYFADSSEILKSPTQMFGVVRPGDVKYKDINGDGTITVDDEVPIGYSTIPQLNYGFGMQARFKNFDAGVFFRGEAKVTYSLGGAYIPFNQGVGKGNLFVQALDRWTPENPNPNAQYPRLFDGKSANNWQPSSKNIYDGSFLRLQTVELGYSVNTTALHRFIGINSLRIYLISDNVALFSKWDMWDPETGTADGSNYPPQRKFNFGIRTSF